MAVGGIKSGRIGYGSDDSQLGGPFIQDDRVAFTATVDRPYYWRGESRVIYTGMVGKWRRPGEKAAVEARWRIIDGKFLPYYLNK